MVKGTKEIKILETFSGIGAQHLALRNLNESHGFHYKVYGTSEWDVFAVISYASIHYPNFEKDIKSPSKEELKIFKKIYDFSSDGKEQMKSVNRWSDDFWITIFKAFKISNNIGSIVNSYKRIQEKCKGYNFLTYSFPCQDLSTAGNFHGFNKGIKKHTRSGLLLEIEKVLEKSNKDNILPKYLLLENVLNLVQKQHRKSFDKWLNKLSKMGYSTIWGVVDSSKYGMIQKRKRVYALSIKDDHNVLGWDKNIRDDLEQELENIYNNEFHPKWIQTFADVFDFKNKNKHESDWAQIKETPSRIRMINVGSHISINSKVVSTVTTKQDRLPNCGWIEYKEGRGRKDSKGTPYTDKRFISTMESYKIMGFNKKEYEQSKKILIKSTKQRNLKKDVNAREKLYKQAGNSIAVNVLEMIFYYIYRKV